MIAIDEQRLDIESSHHTLGQFHACLKNLPKGKKLGIFCYHDILAEEVIQKIKQTNHLQNRKYRIPDDIAIIGFVLIFILIIMLQYGLEAFMEYLGYDSESWNAWFFD